MATNMASVLEWVPETLYNLAVSAVGYNYSNNLRSEVKTLHQNIQFDIYYELYKQGRLCQLGADFCELDTFSRLLMVADKRYRLHHCFQALMDHGTRIAESLSYAYYVRCYSLQCQEASLRLKTIQTGFALGGFLSDAGWYVYSERVFTACLNLCKIKDDITHWAMALDCCIKLLHVQHSYSKFNEASETYLESIHFVERLKQNGHTPNLAALFSEFSSLYFVKSHYDASYFWSINALKELNSQVPTKIIVDVLRQASKACVIKREFKGAELLIKQAVDLARENFGCHHPKYADTLLDYGFYLLNVDLVTQSVRVYQKALDFRQSIFGGKNLHVAVAHEDLAYASYVLEYSSGKFTTAKQHAEKAMTIMNELLPEDNLLLASSKRIKALILEEIAIDSLHKPTEMMKLLDAQDLHLSALGLARRAFGEMNVHTAKHYGNLGRLYQSMKKFKEAEDMHLKAISIKERLLGSEDYEVALSVGHLASLYNYDMEEFRKAEQLYLRSIAIGKKLFGDGYSGLEYDYRGLLRVYSMLGEQEKAAEYSSIFHHWKFLRDSHAQQQKCHPIGCDSPRPLEHVLFEFFSLDHVINLHLDTTFSLSSQFIGREVV